MLPEADEQLRVIVSAPDGVLVGAPVARTTIVNDDNAPILLSDAFTADENTTSVGTVIAVDADGDVVGFALVAGAGDSDLFEIDAATGALAFKAAPDFEAPGDADGDNVYLVTVAASDGIAMTEAQVAVTVSDVNEAPEIVSPPAFEVAENTSAVGDVVAEDPDFSDMLVFSISGGDDAGLFEIDADTGALVFREAPDFEAPGDAGGNNVYNVEVTASDGALEDVQAIAVTVTDVNEAKREVIEGTDGSDFLRGTKADEVLRSLGGRLDLSFGGGGSDVFEFGDETMNGVREIDMISDFRSDDFLNLRGTTIHHETNLFGSTVLTLDGDFDSIVLIGVKDFDEATQLL